MKTIAGPGEWEPGEGLRTPRVVPEACSPALEPLWVRASSAFCYWYIWPSHPLRGSLRKYYSFSIMWIFPLKIREKNLNVFKEKLNNDYLSCIHLKLFI